MVLNNIEQLLEKYDNAETSLKEEQMLGEYFAQDNVPAHLESYKVMFQYFKNTKQEHYTKDVPLKPKNTKTLYQWISVAAVAIVMLGIFIPRIDSFFGGSYVMSPEEKEVYLKTKDALAMLSSNFNDGASNIGLLNVASSNLQEGFNSINALNVASSNFEKGAQHINYVGEFSKQTSKLLKTSN
ncbi:hypothetical protein RM697_03420 [Ichthyenterobacterium sp. W332]|uniref:Uncharacterized protein n=1 Tax=Microcosmobacter mediterraneus TaxID=3075607 RepID=A0ABU2YHM7_9FLAO|nr:hypothetical protein [Ichthyenterobacterium sp. W332]MDT0557679.1 hypothetical protein [Ichthyenterobacterium sp. W332]